MKDIVTVPVACKMLAWNLTAARADGGVDGRGYTAANLLGARVFKERQEARFSNCKPSRGRPFQVAR